MQTHNSEKCTYNDRRIAQTCKSNVKCLTITTLSNNAQRFFLSIWTKRTAIRTKTMARTMKMMKTSTECIRVYKHLPAGSITMRSHFRHSVSLVSSAGRVNRFPFRFGNPSPSLHEGEESVYCNTECRRMLFLGSESLSIFTQHYIFPI